MKKNMGSTDRWIRFLLAATAIVLYLMHVITGTVGIVLMVVAAIFLLTSFVGSCPLYSVLGIGAAKAKKQ
jgi:Inner membrane protein YgaP-like, transmembrane domain